MDGTGWPLRSMPLMILPQRPTYWHAPALMITAGAARRLLAPGLSSNGLCRGHPETRWAGMSCLA